MSPVQFWVSAPVKLRAYGISRQVLFYWRSERVPKEYHFTISKGLVLWDHFRVNRDFLELKTLLHDTRYRAIAKNELLAARFIGKQVVITGRKPGEVIKTLNVPTLIRINYVLVFDRFAYRVSQRKWYLVRAKRKANIC